MLVTHHIPKSTELGKKAVRKLVGARRLDRRRRSYAPNTVHQASIPPSSISGSATVWGDDSNVLSTEPFRNAVESSEDPELWGEEDIFLRGVDAGESFRSGCI